MKPFPAVLKQRRAVPRESSAVSFAPGLRPPTGASRGGRPSGHLSGHPSGRLALRPKKGFLAALRRLRALRFADIPTSPEGRCIGSPRRSHSFLSMLPLAPFAPGAFAIASALASQRFSLAPPRWRADGARNGANARPTKARPLSRGGHPSGHPCGHPSGRPSGHLAPSQKRGLSAAQRRLRALPFADIPTSPIVRCKDIGHRRHRHRSSLLSAPLAPGAFAITSALVQQRLSDQPRPFACAMTFEGA